MNDPYYCESCGYLTDDAGICWECKPNPRLAESIAQLDADIVHKPDHYARFKIEPITMIMENEMEFWRGNLIKYASRAGYKTYDGKSQKDSEITDLQKIIRYATMRINQIEGKDVL